MVAAPIDRIVPEPSPTMKARPRPMARLGDQFVTHRVVMDIVGMSLQIDLVANRMLPKASLPDAPPSLAPDRIATRLFQAAKLKPVAREFSLEPTPAIRIRAIAGRQGPQAMQMIRQLRDRQHRHRLAQDATSKNAAQQTTSSMVGEQCRATIRHHGEEIRPTRHEISPIIGHAGDCKHHRKGPQEIVRRRSDVGQASA
jgi:hypothetical protein